MISTRAVAWLLAVSLHPIPLLAQTPGDNLLARIRKEESDNSQVLKTVHMLADVYGPRLTGSPNHKCAAEWAMRQMQQWGLSSTHLEPWLFGHPGWLNERLTAHIISPVKDPVLCKALSWTPGTRGSIRAAVYQLILPEHPTQEQLTAFLAKERARVRGRIVLAGKHIVVPINLIRSPKRLDERQVLRHLTPNSQPFPTPSPAPTPGSGPRRLTIEQIDEQIDEFLKKNGALVRVNDAGLEFRLIRAFNNPTFDVGKVVPTVVMSNEDYGRVSRLLADGAHAVLEFDIVNRIYPEGKTSYNVIAEIPGADKAEEVVMLGSHLDSWHAATGATDNAIGCAIMMEAARILKTLRLKPRRTIRVALWSGEEEGLLGSQAYVSEHFGSFEHRKPAYEKLDAYLNIDSGTGRVRGAEVFGPPEAGDIIREILGPFRNDGVLGAVATRSRDVEGSDNFSFDQAGLPGIELGQDPIDYQSSWHSNLDTYERIFEDDAKKDAIEVAWTVYQLAMRNDSIPRFTAETMPASWS